MNSLYTPDMIESGARQGRDRLANEAANARNLRKAFAEKRARRQEAPQFSRRDLMPAAVIALLTVFVAVQAAHLVAI